MPNALNCGFQISSEDSNKCQLNNGFYVDKLQNYFKDYSKQDIHPFVVSLKLDKMWNAYSAHSVKSSQLGELGISL